MDKYDPSEFGEDPQDDYERYHYEVEQVEERRRYEIDSDLHSIQVAAERLLSAGLPDRLHDLLELVARALEGCPRCHAQLGHRHLSTCGVLGGQTVLTADLAPYVSGREPQAEERAF